MITLPCFNAVIVPSAAIAAMFSSEDDHSTSGLLASAGITFAVTFIFSPEFITVPSLTIWIPVTLCITVILHSVDIPSAIVQVIMASPGATALTIPVVVPTVAISGLLLLYFGLNKDVSSAWIFATSVTLLSSAVAPLIRVYSV
ncbi:unknown [Clostridium sp. CAG:264]|nr:unknown [Clostridium sp. CAG:264]